LGAARRATRSIKEDGKEDSRASVRLRNMRGREREQHLTLAKVTPKFFGFPSLHFSSLSGLGEKKEEREREKSKRPEPR